MKMTQAKQKSALKELASVLRKGELITDQAGLKPYETDGLTAIREMPWAVALPASETEVIAVMRVCKAHDLPVIPRGAGTGLSGGARPHEGGFPER